MRHTSARGFVDKKRQIALRLSKPTFDKIEKLAMTNGRSFNEQVTVLCDAGLRAFGVL